MKHPNIGGINREMDYYGHCLGTLRMGIYDDKGYGYADQNRERFGINEEDYQRILGIVALTKELPKKYPSFNGVFGDWVYDIGRIHNIPEMVDILQTSQIDEINKKLGEK